MNGKKTVYELGYLLVPTIAEEQVAGEVETIKAVIEKHEGSFITEDFPKLRPLAYEMAKATNGERKRFDTGYFGWIKFETSPSLVPQIKSDLDRNAHILRFMIINTVRENTLVGQKMAFKASDAEKKEVKADEKPMTEEELDKSIDNLVVE